MSDTMSMTLPVQVPPPSHRCDNCYHPHNLVVEDDPDSVLIEGRWYHRACTSVCFSCARSQPSNWGGVIGFMIRDWYCDDCSMLCDGDDGDCGTRIITDNGPYCDNCSAPPAIEDSRGIRGYQRTVPFMWLGGERGQDEKGRSTNFHIGFELEVSSPERDGADVGSLRDWSQNHLGHPAALDFKEDCSVSGFEIVSQPMTPEFFESVNWESFFTVLNRDHETWDHSESREPTAHGLHVHVSKTAFNDDLVMEAMFVYLLGQADGTHLERVARRPSTGYAAKVDKPVSTLLSYAATTGRKKHSAKQQRRLGNVYAGRNAINVSPSSTFEIRAFRSTRRPEHLKAAVRLVYLATQYVRMLRSTNGGFVSPKAIQWDTFVTWVESVHPDAADALRA
jgi:hypothetical protein